MAKISFKEAVKDVEGKLHITLGSNTLDIAQGDTVESSDPVLLSDAAQHPLLQVTPDDSSDVHAQIEAQAKEAQESTDPHVNPKADHLSGVATPEVIEAAEKNVEAIQAGDTVAPTETPAAPVKPAQPAASPAFSTAQTPSTQEHDD